MSNSTPYSSPDYVPIPCNLDYIEVECGACNHAVFASYTIMVIFVPLGSGG